MSEENPMLLRAILEELHDQRTYIQALSVNVNAVCVTCARIEGQLSAIADRQDDHSARLDDECGRVAAIERSAAWVRAWSAGAAAVLAAMFGVVVWVGARVPAIVQALDGGK